MSCFVSEESLAGMLQKDPADISKLVSYGLLPPGRVVGGKFCFDLNDPMVASRYRNATGNELDRDVMENAMEFDRQVASAEKAKRDRFQEAKKRFEDAEREARRFGSPANVCAYMFHKKQWEQIQAEENGG